MYNLFDLLTDLKSSRVILLKEKVDTYESTEKSFSEPVQRTASNVCTVCPNASFDTVSEFRNHYKTDWHKYNIINITQKKKTTTLHQFENMDQGVLSAESEDEDEVLNLSVREIFVEVDGVIHELVLYKKLFEGELSSPLALSSQIESIATSTWCIFLIRSGRASLGIFDNRTLSLIVSKSDKWYTSRKKSGGSQSKRDNKGNGTRNSVGAILRRENEKAMREKINGIVSSWSSYIEKCGKMFWISNVTSRECLFFPQSPISSTDPRLNTIPFSTGDPSFEELNRVYRELTSVKLVKCHNI